MLVPFRLFVFRDLYCSELVWLLVCYVSVVGVLCLLLFVSLCCVKCVLCTVCVWLVWVVLWLCWCVCVCVFGWSGVGGVVLLWFSTVCLYVVDGV